MIVLPRETMWSSRRYLSVTSEPPMYRCTATDPRARACPRHPFTYGAEGGAQGVRREPVHPSQPLGPGAGRRYRRRFGRQLLRATRQRCAGEHPRRATSNAGVGRERRAARHRPVGRIFRAARSGRARRGALVKQGDLLITIDPAPYAAEVDRAKAQVQAAQARVLFTKSELERGEQLSGSRIISLKDLDQRVNANREAEANLAAAKAALQASQLNLDYTQVRAPVTGRVGRLEITVGNLVAAGPGAPVLTSLVSVNPIYASFNADEHVVLRTLHEGAKSVPVEAETVTNGGRQLKGRLQLIDNQVNPKSGTVRVRAVFDNQDGSLIPGQFVKLRMGKAKTESALLVNERAIGTDQDKRFVVVVGPDDKAIWRQVTLGGTANGQRIVTAGLEPGERIVVNGLQRVRPGAQL